MEAAFYIAALLAILTTGLALTRSHAVHALLYLILSLLSISALFLLLGAPFVFYWAWVLWDVASNPTMVHPAGAIIV